MTQDCATIVKHYGIKNVRYLKDAIDRIHTTN